MVQDNDDVTLQTVRVCRSCKTSLSNSKLPLTAIANGLDFGILPLGLPLLDFAEEMLIARVRVRSLIVKLIHSKIGGTCRQRKIRGHVISFPQNTHTVAEMLPITAQQLVDTIQIVFIGSDTAEEAVAKAIKKAKPLTVRRSVVYMWLCFLVQNNPFYKGMYTVDHFVLLTSHSNTDIQIDQDRLQELPEEGVPTELLKTMTVNACIFCRDYCMPRIDLIYMIASSFADVDSAQRAGYTRTHESDENETGGLF